ncbi:MAG: exodeoxyribonuclease VII small subunit [Lachnospiraceae bacterium]|nr:exodeoxyribonuclease VII small subunit [Lachnospiraceae bacterium]
MDNNIKKQDSLEESFEKLNNILTELDTPGISLESSFEKYDEGLKLIKECKEKLDMYEKKLIQINESEVAE